MIKLLYSTDNSVLHVLGTHCKTKQYASLQEIENYVLIYITNEKIELVFYSNGKEQKFETYLTETIMEKKETTRDNEFEIKKDEIEKLLDYLNIKVGE